MKQPLTEYVRKMRGGDYDEFIKKCKEVDEYVNEIENLIDRIFKEYSIEADLFDNESFADFKKYMAIAKSCGERHQEEMYVTVNGVREKVTYK